MKLTSYRRMNTEQLCLRKTSEIIIFTEVMVPRAWEAGENRNLLVAATL